MVAVTQLVLVLTTVLLVGLAAVSWVYREQRGASLFSSLQTVSALWAALTVIGLRTQPGALRLQFWGATSGLSLLVVVLWFAFILDYTGRTQWLEVDPFGFVAAPLVAGACLYFFVPRWTPLAGTVSQTTISPGTVVIATLGPIGALLGVYVYLLFLVGLGLVIKTTVEGPQLFAGQAIAFVFGSLITIVASLLVVLGIGTEGYPLTQVALGAQSLLWGYAVLGQQLLQVVPAVAEIGERAVFDDLDDGILVVNSSGLIVSTNPRAESYLDGIDLPGNRVERVLSVMAVESLDQLPVRFEYEGRRFQADVSEVENWQGEPAGRAVIIRDVSQIVTREQRLAVLNRILRHNVRNDMTIVLGVGEQLQEQSLDGVTKQGELLSKTARNLNRVSEKALEINRMFDRDTQREQVDIETTITEILEKETTNYPEGTVETSLGVDTVQTDPQIFQTVTEEVIANALEHGGEAPTVSVRATVTETAFELTVSDDGPGIPEAELQPLLAGEETDLQHTSSFGLWFINWGVRKIDGTVDITTGGDGTTVTLSIPQAGRPSSESTHDAFVSVD